jgi:hypothetical protein
MDDTGHWTPKVGSETYDKKFYTQTAVDQHMADTGHRAPTFACQTCEKKFHTQSAADQRMRELTHSKHYYQDCEAMLWNEKDLRMVGFHNHAPLNMRSYHSDRPISNSKVHRGSRLICPYCEATYISASGLTHHLEANSCPRAPFHTLDGLPA